MIYALYSHGLGYQLLKSDSVMDCVAFSKLCSAVAKQYGNDMYIIRDVLVKNYGFKQVNVNCVYTVEK